MRLLKLDPQGEICATKDLSDDVPVYAILSHTWGPEGDEVTFDDVEKGKVNKNSGGFAKLQFCGRQTENDGLQYFWVDTCCINKTNHVELSEAITSMFRWYKESAKCYVYLSDVSVTSKEDDQSDFTWEADFCNSRWFERGWTLQELLAPVSVDFFSREGTYLGSKKTLEAIIHRITKIPIPALQGKALSYFSTDERFGWTSGRNTKKPEDAAYCLLGIFNIFMPLIYGEGENAIRRLKDEISRQGRTTSERPFQIPFYIEAKSVYNFIGREDEIFELDQMLISDSTSGSSRRIFVANGMGGVGKTQLALRFAHKHKERFDATIWLDGSSKGSLGKSFADFATRLHQLGKITGEQPGGDSDANTETVLSWLSLPDNKNWLMIFDNVDRDHQAIEKDEHAYDVEKFIPRADHGAILITTRLDGHFRLGLERKIDGVLNEDAIRILEINMGRSVQAHEDAGKTLQMLGGLPLALTLAGSYIRDVGITLSDYDKLYDQKWGALIKSQDRYQLREYADRSMLTTWLMSFEQVDRENSDAIKLLDLWSFFANTGLSFEIFDSLQSFGQDIQVPDWLGRVTEDDFAFNEAVRPLLRYSLINRPNNTGGYSVHTVLHEWCFETARQRYETRELRTMCGLVSALIAYRVPFDDTQSAYWQTRRDLLPHAMKLCQRIEQCFSGVSDLAWQHHLSKEAVFNIGRLLASLSELWTAERMYLRALAGYEKALGREHTSTLDTVNSLGVLYTDQGKLNEAEKMYLRALTGKEKALGREHTSTLETVNNLGILYKHQGKLDEAEKMYLRALTGKEKALGREHTSTLDAVNNLGVLYAHQGKLDEAEKMYLRALTGYEKAFGISHWRTCIINQNYLAIQKKS